MLVLAVLAACGPEVRGRGPEIAAPRLEPGAIVASDDVRLTLHEAQPEGNPRGVVLLLHGLSNHGGQAIVEDAPPLTERGLLVYAYDQRGHGRTPTRGVWPGEEALVDDAVTAIRLLRTRHPDLPFHVGGLSMGANVALLAADRLARERQAELVDRWVIASAALWTEQELRLARRFLLTLGVALVPRLGFTSPSTTAPSTDNWDSAERVDADPLTVMDMRPDLVAGLVTMNGSARGAMARCCAAVTLFLFGAHDGLIEPAATIQALRRLPPGSGVRVAYYAEGWHMLLRDRQRAVVAEDILTFLADPTAPLPSGADAAAAAWMERGG